MDTTGVSYELIGYPEKAVSRGLQVHGGRGCLEKDNQPVLLKETGQLNNQRQIISKESAEHLLKRINRTKRPALLPVIQANELPKVLLLIRLVAPRYIR